MLNTLLVAAGIRTLHYMSRNSRQDRDLAVAAFNDPDELHTCLITSLQLSAFGLNFHKACHRGITVESPANLSHELQAIGRLYRLGQLHDVEWKVLNCRGSFDSYFEARNMAKYVTILTVGGQVPSQIQGELRVICAYELLRDQLGQACSRYPRAQAKWNEMDSDALYRDGLFYSVLAQGTLGNPDQVHRVDSQRLGGIALSWEPGTPLTFDHITSEREPLSDNRGVTLERREDDKVKDDQASHSVDETYASEEDMLIQEDSAVLSEKIRKREDSDEAVKRIRYR